MHPATGSERNMILAPFIRILRKEGWKQRYDTVAGGGRCVEFFKFFGQREVQVQLHDDGLFRATHMLYSDKGKTLGTMSTAPTTFRCVPGMWQAVKHEQTRTDHPHRGARR